MSLRRENNGKPRLGFWLVLVLIPAILLSAFGIYRWRCASVLKNRLNALSSTDYPVTLTELDRWYETPAPGQNAADYVTAAISYLTAQTAEETEHLPSFTSDRLQPRTEPLDETVLGLIAGMVKRNQQAIELLEKAATMPSSRFRIDLTRGHRTLISHVGHFRRIVHLFNLKAMMEAQQGRTDLATDTLITSLDVVHSLVDEPLLISQTVCSQCQSEITEPIEWIVNQATLKEDDLKRLQEALTRAYDPNGMIRGFIGQQCMTIQLLQYPYEAGLDLDLDELGDAPSLFQVRTAQVTGRADRYLVRVIDLTEYCLAVMQMPPTRRLWEANAIEAKAQRLPEPHKTLGHFAPRFDQEYFVWDIQNLARLHVAATALAVERYRLHNGYLPDRLEALVPAFLNTVPQDPFDDKPLRYKKRDKGFVVYSVNEDGRDDGPRERPPRKKRSDPPGNYDITFTVER